MSCAMLDLGSLINVLPYSLFKIIGVGPLKITSVIIQLVDRSLVHPKGVTEDVLVQMNELIFQANFYVLDMGDDDSPNSNYILLGRPFLITTRTSEIQFSWRKRNTPGHYIQHALRKEESKLIGILNMYRNAVGWTI